jgi:hypothetical protein
MLLNASHELTGSGLPPNLQEVRVRYKRSTRGILKWFQKRSAAGARSKKLTLKELEALVHQVSQEIPGIPAIVHFYFKEAIADRKHLTRYYRAQLGGAGADATTEGHEHFTAW